MVRNRAWVVVVVVFMLVRPGLSQRSVAQRGNALDSSPQVGSGGSNSGGYSNDAHQALGRYDQLNAERYATGRMAGVGNFRGTLPYTPVGQYQIDLPSSSLDDFERRSVNLESSLGGNPYLPTPYSSPYNDVLSAGDIAAGLNQPGTNAPRSTSTPLGLAADMRVNALADYRALLPTRSGQLLSSPLNDQVLSDLRNEQQMTQARQERDLGGSYSDAMSDEQDNQQVSGELAAMPEVYRQSGGPEKLFGMLGANRRDRLRAELYGYALDKRLVQGRVDANFSSSYGQEYRLGDEQLLPPELAAEANGGGLEAQIRPLDFWAMPRRNQDVYTELMLRLGDTRRRDSSGADEAPADPLDVLPEPITGMPEPAKSIVEIGGEDDTIIVHRLAGMGTDELNRHIARAEDLLRRGRYYEAAGAFRTASYFDRDNPLPLLGMSLSFFGAGEFYTTGLYARKAMENFPALVEVRVDLDELSTRVHYVKQLASLERWLRQDPFLKRNEHVYLAGAYIARQLNQDQEAKRYAQILLELPAKHEVSRVFAHYVIDGQLPDAQDDTPPVDELYLPPLP